MAPVPSAQHAHHLAGRRCRAASGPGRRCRAAPARRRVERLLAVARDPRPVPGALQVARDDLARSSARRRRRARTRVCSTAVLILASLARHGAREARASRCSPTVQPAACDPRACRRELGHAGGEVLAGGSRALGGARRRRRRRGARRRAGSRRSTSGAGASRPAAACSARAMSPTLRGRPRADVERARRRLRRGERQHVGAGDVADVDEVAQLPAVLEDLRRRARPPARERKMRRDARRTACRAASAARRRCGSAAPSPATPRLARERGGQVLLVELGRRVDVARIDAARPRGPASGASGAPHAGHGGSKRPASRSATAARPGAHDAVLGAAVAALAVDDHARGQHEPRRAKPSARRARAAARRCRGRCGAT